MIYLSVIIPTRNRAKLLDTTLESIIKQTLSQNYFEVIVCDNNSTDNTKMICDKYTTSFLNFRYIKTVAPGLHVGRNKGFQEAKGEVLVYADDDIVAFPEWLATIYNCFKNDDSIVLVGGKNIPNWETPPPDWVLEMWKPNKNNERIIAYYSVLDFGDEIQQISAQYVWGCNFSVRKRIIELNKGFHPDGVPQEMIEYRGDGETAISNYIDDNKLKTLYHPKASVLHFVPQSRMTINYLKKWAFNNTISKLYTDTRSGNIEVRGSMLSVYLHYFKLLFYNHNNAAKIYLAREKAFRFYQKQLEKNPKLKEWVLKEHYLE